MSGRAAAMAGLKRSVWPTASGTPARGGRGDHGVGFFQRPRHRLLDEDRHASRQERHRDVPVQLRGDGDRHRVDLAEELAEVAERPGPVRAGDLGGARGIDVNDRDQIDARQRGQNPGVMAAEIPDPDDPYAQRHTA